MDLSEPQMSEVIKIPLKNRVLITSVSRKVGLVQAFKDAGWIVHGKDSDSSVVGLRFCDGVFTGRYSDYDLIVPTRDGELLEFAGMTGIASEETIRTCLDKFEFYKWCKSNGFKTPEVYFVKPRISKSGKEVECVWQEFVNGKEYSVDLFAAGSGNVISAVPRERVKIIGGEASVTTTVIQPTLVEESIELSRRLGLIGHNVLQAIISNGVIYWTDVNCRFGGASVVGIKAGCRSPEWLLDMVNGREIDSRLGVYRVGLTGYSFSEWIFQ